MSFSMNKNRIESFSDGVIAIIITIMVLELHIPELKEIFTDKDVWVVLLSLVPKILALSWWPFCGSIIILFLIKYRIQLQVWFGIMHFCYSPCR